MNQQHEMKQIAPNIFKITRFSQIKQAQTSMFVKEPADSLKQSSKYSCSCDTQGYYHFFLNQKEVLRESDSFYTQGFSIGETDAAFMDLVFTKRKR